MTSVATRTEHILSEMIDLTDKMSKPEFDTLIIQAPIWDADPGLQKNTANQMTQFFSLMHTLITISRHVVKPSGWLWLVAQDAYRPIIVQGKDDPNELTREKLKKPSLLFTSITIAEAATRFVADSLNLPLPQTSGSVWWQEEKRHIIVKWVTSLTTGLGAAGVIDPAAIYVLVAGENTDELIIQGWIEGIDLEKNPIQAQGSSVDNAACYVPIADLRPFGDLLYWSKGMVKPLELMGLPWRLGALAQQGRWFLKGEFFLKFEPWNTGIGLRDHESLLLFSRNAVGQWINEQPAITTSWLDSTYLEALPSLITKTTPMNGKVLSLFTDATQIENAISVSRTNASFINIG